MLKAIRHHSPEYLMESAELGIFMISAGLFTTLLEYPASPVHQSIPSEFIRRSLSGLAMGLTAVGLIYSPWGQQSGAHFNPAVTLWKLISPRRATACAKLNHQTQKRCIFCGYRMQVVFLLLFLGPVALKAQVTPLGVGPITITVSDLDRSVDFYTQVLSFQKESETEAIRDSFDRLTGIFGTNIRVATLRLGVETVQLVEYRTPPGRQVPSDSQSNDSWFQHIAIVVRDMDTAYARLREHKVGQISTNPQTLPQWNSNAGGIKAYYFRDPDNHSLELIYFPAGKGDPRWQQPGEALFLGIDHTAIAVSDTRRDLSFYRNLLGFRIVGESLNYGSEQEELTHVFGSRLLITSLRAPAGPGIEFLEYLTPRGGRSFPANTQQNDLWSWSTTLIVKDLPAAVAELRRQNATFISAEQEDVSPLGESGAKGVLIRDPEGHALLLRSE